MMTLIPSEIQHTQRISAQISPSTCRHCQFYTPEGQRGGHCQQLRVSVRGSWKACALALPPSAPSWEGVKGS